MSTVVVTGASRGIGLELARQFAERGDRVLATARRPEASKGLGALAKAHSSKVALHVLDTSSTEAIRAFAKEIGGTPVDVLVNNAGAGGHRGRITDVDLSDVVDVFRTNALGPLVLSQALLPNLRAGTGRKIVHITSRMGSITDHPAGGYYAYRMSKTALNMASVCMSVDLKSERIVSVVINPGWVQTDMGGSGAPTPVEDSVGGILKILDALGPKDSGKGFHFDGSEMPY